MESSEKPVIEPLVSRFTIYNYAPVIETMCRDRTLIAFRFACVADPASKSNKVHVKRICLAFSDNLWHQFMGFLRGTI